MKKTNLSQQKIGKKLWRTFYFFFVLLICSTSNLFAQESTIVSKGETGNVFGSSIDMYTTIREKHYQKQLQGSFYLQTDWQKADITIDKNDQVFTNLKTRIDLRNHLVEIMYKDKIHVLPSRRVLKLVFIENDKVFVTDRTLKSNNQGFYRLLVEGKNTLLCKYDTKIKKAHYNVALDTGKRDDQIIQEKCYYLFHDQELLKLEKTKGRLKKQFSKTANLTKYLSENKISTKNEFSLVSFVNFLNSNQLSL